jgi:hypothetical protein
VGVVDGLICEQGKGAAWFRERRRAPVFPLALICWCAAVAFPASAHPFVGHLCTRVPEEPSTYAATALVLAWVLGCFGAKRWPVTGALCGKLRPHRDPCKSSACACACASLAQAGIRSHPPLGRLGDGPHTCVVQLQQCRVIRKQAVAFTSKAAYGDGVC